MLNLGVLYKHLQLSILLICFRTRVLLSSHWTQNLMKLLHTYIKLYV